jgi:hypothetical protein
MDLTKLFENADKVSITSTVSNNSRQGVYVSVFKGLTHGLYFVGTDLTNNAIIKELVD